MPTPSINSNNVITGTNVKIPNGAPTKADVMCKAMCMVSSLILKCSSTGFGWQNSWEGMPEMVSLGNRSLSLLRVQQGYVVRGARLSDVLTEMEANQHDYIDRSIQKASKKNKNTWTPKSRPTKAFLGPGRWPQQVRKN